MKLYLKIILTHKILLFLLLCGLNIYFFCFDMLMYKFVIELLNNELWDALKHTFFYFIMVLVLCFDLDLILDKIIVVCKSQLDVLLLCGFPLEDIIKKFMMILSLCGMLSGIVPNILFFFLVLGNIGFHVLLLSVTYIVFLLLCFMEYIKTYRTLSGRFNNV